MWRPLRRPQSVVYAFGVQTGGSGPHVQAAADYLASLTGRGAPAFALGLRHAEVGMVFFGAVLQAAGAYHASLLRGLLTTKRA